jgi:hypothetical protein
MKQPTPSDFIVNVQGNSVSVIFKPSNSEYNFGRLADRRDCRRASVIGERKSSRYLQKGCC